MRLRKRTAVAGVPPGGRNRIKAFRIGLLGALGVGVGLIVWGAVATLATLILLVGLALFAALGIDPVVCWLERRKLPRPAAVTLDGSARYPATADGVPAQHCFCPDGYGRDMTRSVTPLLVTVVTSSVVLRHLSHPEMVEGCSC